MPIPKKNVAVLAANRWTIITLISGVLVSSALSLGIAHFHRQEIERSTKVAAEATADAVVRRLQLYQYGLRGVRGAVVALGEKGINRNDFDNYSRSRDIDEEFVGARGFGFIRRVARQDEAVFLAKARADGWPDFAIRQLAPHNAERFVIQYISNLKRNKAAVGLDIASEANRRQAAISAMRSGEVRLTGPITLVQATGLPQQAFLILMPVYRDGRTPNNATEREANAFGWSYAPLITDEVLNGIRPKEQAVSIKLRDITDPAQAVDFYSSTDDDAQVAIMNHITERDVYGRRWQLHFTAHPAFVSKLNQLSHWLILAVGLVLSVLLASLVGALNLGRKRQRQIIAEQSRLAAIVESSADGIIGKDLDGTVTSWNGGAEALFGYNAEEAVGRRIVDLIVPAELQAEELSVLAAIREGRVVPSFSTLRRHKNHQLVHVAVTVSPIRDSHGKVVGASKTIRDITRQVEAEARIHELNSDLEAQVAKRTVELDELNLLLSNVLRSASEVAIIATDLDGTIRVFNTGAERMLGYCAEEMIGKRTPATFHLAEEVTARAAQLTAQFGKTIEGFQVFVHKAELGAAETREWTYVHKDGSRLPVSLAVTEMRDERGISIGYLGIAVDLSEQKASEAAVAYARDQLLLAAEVAELGIWSWTLADNTLSWNDRMFEIYGQPLDLRETGLNYEHWRSRIHPDDVERVEKLLSQAVDGNAVYDPVFRVVRPDGSECIVQAGAQVERDVNGAVRSVTGINLDITAQRELEARLLEAKEQADASSAAKSSFLANMSHEIRTPMNAVLGMLHLVQNTELNTRQQDYISNAESAAKSLLGLLNDILDFSKIEAGKLVLDAHAFDPETLMRDLAVVLSGNQGGKDVEVLFDLDPRLPLTLLGDSQRLLQVLINLAGNALKFTPRGQITVRFVQLQQHDEQVRIRVEVIDTGIGISPEQLQRIFDGFTQAEASTTRRFGGTGLGLVISKRLIGLMGGELQVSSTVDVGSRFWFDIDLGVYDEQPLRASCPGTDQPMHLLVADDNEMAGHLLVSMAEALGWRADLVSDGLQAVEKTQRMAELGQHYDVILMDWRMPNLDGLSAAKLIHERRKQKNAPVVIMITAYGREVLADAQQEGDAPFAGFLSKPITPQQLATTIQRALTQDKSPQLSVAEQRAAQPQRLAGLRLLVVEDNALNRQVAFELLTAEGAQVTMAEGGVEGVQKATGSLEAFDAVLMDIQMPDIDGLEAARQIRQDAKRGAVKIIAMTANASTTDMQACLAAGMNDHIGKPIDVEKLVATLLRHTGGTHLEASPQQYTEPQGAKIESVPSILQRFGGNRGLIQTVLSHFVSEQETQLARLRESFDQCNAADAAAVLHAIKGSSATVGARALSMFAGDLEQRLHHADNAKVVQLLSDSSLLDQLHQLLNESDALLKAAFELSPNTSPPVREYLNVLPHSEWQDTLRDILHLLEAGNMQAIEHCNALAKKTPQEYRVEFDQFIERVTMLDFPAAQLIGRSLLNHA